MSDTDNSFAGSAVPEIQNKAQKAPGILPKNAQTWVIVIIAAVMIVVIAFSNSASPTPKPKSVSAPQQSVSPPNQRQIDLYRAMVDEEARKLATERQRLDQAKLDSQNAAINAQVPGQTIPYQNPYTPNQYLSTGNGTKETSPEEVQRNALEAERKKREYNSFFSSNVALSYRKDQNPSAPGNTAGSDQPSAILPSLQAISAEFERPSRIDAEPGSTIQASAICSTEFSGHRAQGGWRSGIGKAECTQSEDAR